MNLYILRHAIAADRGSPGFTRDSERPLTAKGAKKMRAAAAGMRALGVAPSVILTSPFVRARRTAEIVADVLGREDMLEECASLAADGDPERVIPEVRARMHRGDSVLLVGHEPMLSGLISTLLCGHPDIPVTMKKGGLCLLSVSTLTYGPCATLEWLLTPRQLAAMG